jgi:adenosylcobinamide-GDP ribazoletransferase
MLSALAVAMIVLLISKKEFGGVTGDVMGATNELTRLASLLVILVAAKWL